MLPETIPNYYDIVNELNTIQNIMHDVKMSAIQGDIGNYSLRSLDAAIRAEWVACKLRSVIYTSTTTEKNDYLHVVSEQMGIQIYECAGVYTIKIPVLLPKTKQKKPSEFLIDPLYNALFEYAESFPIEKFKHCTVCFTHVYADENKIRDYDNLELKNVLDVVGAFFLVDDSGKYCNTYHTTMKSSTDHTIIQIMGNHVFPEWLNLMPNSTVKNVSHF